MRPQIDIITSGLSGCESNYSNSKAGASTSGTVKCLSNDTHNLVFPKKIDPQPSPSSVFKHLQDKNGWLFDCHEKNLKITVMSIIIYRIEPL